MMDLIDALKKAKAFRGPDENLAKLGSKNAHIIREELRSVEAQYLQICKKYKENKDYLEVFLGINLHLSFLYTKYDEITDILIKYVHPLVLKQTKLRFNYLKLEEKYENSSEILKERRKLQEEKHRIINKRSREELDVLYPQSIVSSRAELKVVRKRFLELYKKYQKNSKFENEFLKKSMEYAKALDKVKKLKDEIKKVRKTKLYQKMLSENYIRYSILEDILIDGVGNI
jgi:hypothetical protein